MLAGKIIAGPYVREACARHMRDLASGHERGLRFDRKLALRKLEFFPDVLCLNGGQFEGKPFDLIGFQEFIVGSIHGWVREDRTRRFRTAYVEMGKGNGKSPLAGGLGLQAMAADDEQRAEVYAAATTKDQAMILFRDAVAMVNQSPILLERVTKTPDGPACENIGYPEKASFFRCIAAGEGKSGPRPHWFLIDELHEHPNGDVVLMAAAGQKFRRQPMNFEITNSGFDRTSVCFAHHQYSIDAVRALPGEKGFDDSWFAYVCALDEGEDPFESEACWIKANPGLGQIIQLDYLRKQVREARGMPAQASTVRRLNFCEWVDAENPWIEGHLWRNCEAVFDPFERLAECPEVCGGLDLSGTTDLTALALTGTHPDGETVAMVEFWTPGQTHVERGLRDRVPYDAWIRAGFVHATPGRAVDYAYVAQRLVELNQRLPNFRRCAFDPYRMPYLEAETDALSCEVTFVKHPQGPYKPKPEKDENGDDMPVLWMPRSIEVLAKDIADDVLRVLKNPCLTWNNASAVLQSDEKNNKTFSKRKSTGRIDGVIALAMAEGLLHLGAAPEENIDDFINSPVIA